MDAHALRGACSCGRNHYVVEIPAQRNPSELDVFLDNSSTTRRHHAAPLTAFLRVPITWYHSTTVAYFPDETHSSIRRTYTDPSRTDTQRQFCGYCGTQLNRWTERQREDADFILLTVGSIFDEDVAVLNDLGLLPRLAKGDDDGDGEQVQQGNDSTRVSRETVWSQGDHLVSPSSSRHVLGRGSPWFEEMIEDLGLGRVKTKRGGYIDEDGTAKLDYEIIEVEEDENSDANSSSPTVKRKWQGGLGGRDAGDRDVNMSGALRDT